MGKDSAALLLAVAAGCVFLAGLYGLVTASAGSARLTGAEGEGTGAGRRLLALGDARMRRTGAGERIVAWLRGAGIKLSAFEYVLGTAVLALLLFVLGRLFLGGAAAFVVAVVASVLAGRFYVGRRRAQRRDQFIGQLPELARILGNGTQAGLSMAGAVQLAARELDDPAGAEMRAVLDEMRMGRALDESLESLRARVPSREVAVLMTTVVIQQRAGGDTVRALQELATTLDARKDLLREIKTLLSGSVFTSYVVAGIGVGTIVLTNAVSPGVLREMTSSVIGLLSLGAAAILWTIAFVLIRATTRVDV